MRFRWKIIALSGTAISSKVALATDHPVAPPSLPNKRDKYLIEAPMRVIDSLMLVLVAMAGRAASSPMTERAKTDLVDQIAATLGGSGSRSVASQIVDDALSATSSGARQSGQQALHERLSARVQAYLAGSKSNDRAQRSK
ncbi:hypothetical protein Pst134EB_029582 [Puccinia striiformis f. sp. tritici]|nr:hypothetical protein Pst134EB_029582 [Puccinia striiformis f. sp. tritici]